MLTTKDLDHTPLTWGKYKGKTPKDLKKVDPAWLCWAYESVRTLPTCSAALYKACEKDVRGLHARHTWFTPIVHSKGFRE